MKRSLAYLLLALMATSFYACSEDSLSSESVIKVDQGVKNEFDAWLMKTYTKPYNIDFKYRMEDIESDMSHYLVPADYNQSIRMAHLIKHLCLDVYDEVVSSDFTKRFFPKMIHLVGSAAYNNNGTMVLGSAEGGLKITLYMINDLDPTDVPMLNEYYFHTIHHEFTHILTQTVPYSSEFDQISSKDYISDNWNTLKGADALKKGFITPYASKEANEDFAELVSVYITSSEAEWNKLRSDAGAAGAKIIDQKFVIIANYMKNVWGFNISNLRDVIQQKSSEVPTLNLDELKIN
jgi:substrate import-associated zinc metallohydrolase lipoprotein